MKSKLLLSALFKFRNLLVLLAAIFLATAGQSYFSGLNFIPYPQLVGPAAVAAVYAAFVAQTLKSSKFHEEFNRKQKIKLIQDLNYSCLRLSSEAKKHTNAAYLQRLKKVMDDKNDIVNSFFRGEHSYLKEKIVEQTLNLVVSYIKLLTNFCIRSRELSGLDLSEITNRINTNMRKLSFIKDSNALEDVKKVIEMDEKIIGRMKDEKKDLERISAKLEYMESTVNMFKHQIISSIESEDMLEQLETAVNEATALDTVLDERRKNKINL